MEESYGREGAAGDEDEGCAVGGLDSSAEAGSRKFVVREGHGGYGVRHCGGWRRWGFVEREEVVEVYAVSVGADKGEVLRASEGGNLDGCDRQAARRRSCEAWRVRG